MEAVFLIAGVLIASVCWIAGRVPDPMLMMETVRRDHQPRRFYILIGAYLLLGAALSTGSWFGGDRLKNATIAADPQSK